MTTANQTPEPFVIANSMPSWISSNFDFLGGELLSWVDATQLTTEIIGQRSIVVDFQELISHEARSRHNALAAACLSGNQLIVVSGPNIKEFSGAQPKITLFPLDSLESYIAAIKAVLPFDTSFTELQYLREGVRVFRFVVGSVASQYVEEIIPVPQFFWSNGTFGLHLGKGFYGIEKEEERSFGWMGKQGEVLVASNCTRLVKVTLWFEPFVPRPQKINFHGNTYKLISKTKIVAYHCVIPGLNPLNISVEGPVDSPMSHGLSDDSRELSLKLVGGNVEML